MDASLCRLVEALPPPYGLTDRDVKWGEVEREAGLSYPSHFKELIGVYGGSNWFDLYHLLYPDPSETTGAYLEAVRGQVSILAKYGMTDKDFKPVKMPLYPEAGGLFPFMASSDGDYYFWRTDSGDPDRWPMLRWEMDVLRTLTFPTLADLLLDTL